MATDTPNGDKGCREERSDDSKLADPGAPDVAPPYTSRPKAEVTTLIVRSFAVPSTPDNRFARSLWRALTGRFEAPARPLRTELLRRCTASQLEASPDTVGDERRAGAGAHGLLGPPFGALGRDDHRGSQGAQVVEDQAMLNRTGSSTAVA